VAFGRLTGDRLIERFGRETVVRTGALLAATGLGTGLIAGTVPAALAGWTLLGLGQSMIVPSIYFAAGVEGPRTLAAVATTGNIGLMAGPALIGAIASVSSLPLALVGPVVLVLILAVSAVLGQRS
jgi:MFS family permease